ncbi:tetratricopeptide repeat protein [Pseudomonas segetis]|uniref:Import receptor subunit TOM20 n=1 Tax=Pseudomonas segetis TaxID=298908 RepID=A0A239CTC2_9PSED|nr:tetratricopeptide repeat protein [Pseudomonas segetis]SNS22774.1 import receptor subunit TOM20 [Pseudomonas segetis]
MPTFIRNAACILLCLASLPALALSSEGQDNLKQLQQRWAEINYSLPADQREAAFEKLSVSAEQAVKSEPDSAELLIWNGIILSTYAGAKGGLGALGLVKDAKAKLEQALQIDPRALSGSAYTSLGSLYYQVPGWPIGFGDDSKAETMLKQALAINPSGIDPNYFYADFLFRQKHYQDARKFALKAQQAAPRPGRETADKGRMQDISLLLKKIDAELK